MTRAELKREVAKVRAAARASRSYAYCFAQGRDGLVEIRVSSYAAPAYVRPVDARGVATGPPSRIRPWTKV
jgi:hypothetical protein